MSIFKLSNHIFDLGLTAKELSVYAYLCSLPSDTPTFDGTVVKVKQSTIALNCGIKDVHTIAKVITVLKDKELVEPVKREIKANKHKGTYIYNIKKLPVTDSFFFVDRYVFGRLTPIQMYIYLFICKSYSNKLNDCWNSYNDISSQTGMKREMIIKAVSELEELKLIIRLRRKSKSNRRMFVDNHYQIIFFVHMKMRKSCKKIERLHCECNRSGGLFIKEHSKSYIKNNTFKRKCQGFRENFFKNRGSPSNHILI